MGVPATPTPTPNDGSDRQATTGDPATHGEPAAPTGGSPATPAAGGSTHRPSDAPAFEPSQADRGPAGPPRPLLPPAPVVPRRGRGRSLAVVGLLLVLGLAAVLMAVNLRSNDDGNPTATPGTTGVDSATSRPSATTLAATTTAAPETTEAPSTTAAENGLPAGWEAYTNRAGSNRVGVPPGFRARTRQKYNATVVEERDDPKRVFTVRSTNPANPLPQASRDYRAWAPKNLDGFREVSYRENQTYAGRKGAVVFEYEANIGGRRVHVSHINVKGRTWGYNVEFIAPTGAWDASKGLASQFETAFEPLG
jgi:hypothetical protein